jgi:hypothetical protein
MIFNRSCPCRHTLPPQETAAETVTAGNVAADGWNGGRGSVAPLPPFPVAVGLCRHLLRRLEATFANFWIHYIFSENREKYIKNKKIL